MMSNAHARVKHRKVMKGKMKTVTESCTFSPYTYRELKEYIAKNPRLKAKLTGSQSLCRYSEIDF
jgi:hypothetical protein